MLPTAPQAAAADRLAPRDTSGNALPWTAWGTPRIRRFRSSQMAQALPIHRIHNISDQANSILKLATPVLLGNCGPGLFKAWSCTTIDNGRVGLSFHDVGSHPGIALNPAGLLRVAYTDSTSGEVRYAEQILRTFLTIMNR